MDDVLPFLVFIVIALINLVKFMLEKNAKKTAKAPDENQSTPPLASSPSTMQEFFEGIAEKFEPPPIPVPDWAEKEERSAAIPEQIIYAPPPEPVAEIIPMPVAENRAISSPPQVEIASFKSTMSTIPSVSSGLRNIRFPSLSGMNNGSGGRINYSLKSKAALRKAILAQIVFSAPRAFDESFKNTIVK
ncbi:MAG: hypothetical protein V5783_11585 [Pontiella sp.]